MRYVMMVAFTLSLLLSQAVSGAENSRVKLYFIKVALKDKPAAGSREKGVVLAEPQVMVVENNEAILNIGGETIVGETKIPSGRSLVVKVTSANDKKVRIEGVLETSSVATVEGGVVSRESYSVHFDKFVELGVASKIRVSKSPDKERWFELLVDIPNGLQPTRISGRPAAVATPATRDSISDNGGQAPSSIGLQR